ncbi:OmpH family outer membrane protein [Pelagibius marinus]|uniref:OmpH family outer membrane protein n=1 Tax=Pelagibius marinus TaxID=2762760 RepID=UPI0018722E17|nr:OmpH family outer membrane protein [Pelagibius marinus]
MLLSALFTAASSPVAWAQIERAPLIGIIDIQAVLRESEAVHALSRKIEARREAAQAGMQDREEALRAADLDLAQRRSALSVEQYAEERGKLEDEGIALQREAQEQRRQLDQIFSRGMSQVQQVLVQISQDIARENNLDLVLAKTTVILVRSEFDFTEEALQRLNARLADVTLPDVPN